MEIKLIKKLKAAGVDDSTLVKLLLEEDQAEENLPPEQPKEEPAPETPANPAPEPAAPAPNPDPVLAAIKELTGVIYASNIARDGRPDDKTPADLAADTLAKILTGAPE